MPRTAFRAQRAFSLAIGLTLAGTFLPTRWLVPLTTALADLVNVFVQPLGHLGTAVGRVLRPGDDPGTGEAHRVQTLLEDRDELRGLLQASRLKILRLHEEIRELQDTERFHRGPPMRPLMVRIDRIARITGRSPDRSGGLERLNVGTRDGVTAGTVAVFRGVHLIGRVAEDVGRLSCWLVPITDPSSGLVEAFIESVEEPLAPVATAPRVQLRPDGTGALVGDVGRDRAVTEGATVRLSDPAWPETAQGMIVGFVESVRPKETEPLLVSVMVRPQYRAHLLVSVTLKIDYEEAGAEGGQP